MNFITNYPHLFIWYSIPVILLISIFGVRGRSLNIQMHDTYFVFGTLSIGILFSIILGVIGFIYWFMLPQSLLGSMTVFHIIITILLMISVLLISLIFNQFVQGDFEKSRQLQNIIRLIFYLFIFCQVILLINVILSVVTNK